MIRHTGPVSGVAWGGGTTIATAGYDNQILLWRDGEARFRGSHDHLANQCSFSACGRFLVSASSDHSARIWSATDLRLLAILGDHEDDVEMAMFDPAGHRVATASRDGKGRIFDRSGRLLHRLQGHGADVISIEWIADGRELVSCSDDGTVRRWCAETGRQLAVVDMGAVETDTVVQAGPHLYAGTDQGMIALIGENGVRSFPAHEAGIKRLAYHPGARMLASAGYDRAVKLWHVADDGGIVLFRSGIAPASIWLRSLAFMGEELLFGSFGGGYARCGFSLQDWDVSQVAATDAINAVCWWKEASWTVGDAGIVRRDGQPVRELGSLCNFLVGSRDRLFTGGHLGELMDAGSGAILYRHSSPLNCGVVVTSGRRSLLIVGSYTGEAILLDITGQDVRPLAIARLHDNAIKGLASNGDQLFSVCATGAAAFHRLPDLASGQALAHAHDKISNGAGVLPDGRFVSVSRDRRLRLWDAMVATSIATPHSHSIKCVAVCPVSGLVATGAYNGLVAIFDPRSGAWPVVHRASLSGISSLCWGGREGIFLASSYDGQVHRLAHEVDAKPLFPQAWRELSFDISQSAMPIGEAHIVASAGLSRDSA